MGRHKITNDEKLSITQVGKKHFTEWFRVGAMATTADGTETMIVVDGEEFSQTEYCPYHYMSTLGHVISFADKNNSQPVLMKKDEQKNGHYKTRNKWVHIEQAKLFPERVETYGKPPYQIHHSKQHTSNTTYEEVENVDTYEKVNIEVHKEILNRLQNTYKNRTEKQEEYILSKLSRLSDEQEPNKFTVVIDNGAKQTSIHATNDTEYSEDGMFSVLSFCVLAYYELECPTINMLQIPITIPNTNISRVYLYNRKNHTLKWLNHYSQEQIDKIVEQWKEFSR